MSAADYSVALDSLVGRWHRRRRLGGRAPL